MVSEGPCEFKSALTHFFCKRLGSEYFRLWGMDSDLAQPLDSAVEKKATTDTT